MIAWKACAHLLNFIHASVLQFESPSKSKWHKNGLSFLIQNMFFSMSKVENILPLQIIEHNFTKWNLEFFFCGQTFLLWYYCYIFASKNVLTPNEVIRSSTKHGLWQNPYTCYCPKWICIGFCHWALSILINFICSEYSLLLNMQYPAHILIFPKFYFIWKLFFVHHVFL